MDIYGMRAIFMWCTILNVALLLLTSLACIFFSDFSYRMNNKFFSISRQEFNVILVSFIALYKIFVMAFNLVPYSALSIVAG